MTFSRAIATVGGLTLVSRIAGFVRDILTAAILGAGPVADAFFVALKLPNLFRHLFAEGAFSVSFVPLFAGELAQGGRAAAQRFAEEALAVMLAVLLPFTICVVVAMPWAMTVLAPGFTDDPAKFALAVELARITFPYLPLISLVALLGGMLNSVDRFAPFAAAPIAFNLTLIAALLGLTPFVPSAGHAMAYGVVLSGMIQLVWMVWACRRARLPLHLPWPRLTPRLRRLFRLMGPGVVGAGITELSLFVDIVLASLLPSGAVSWLYYAGRLYQLPLGVIGIAIGTALLPLLSRHLKLGNDEAARHFQNRALEFALILGVPAAVALIAIPGPILAVLFERGAFASADTQATAAALAAYAIGIPAYVIAKVLTTAYFARQDTKSPVKAAALATLANSLLSLALIWPLGHVGIALATGVTAWLNVALLAAGLRRRGVLVLDARLRRRAPRILVACAGLGGVLYAGSLALAPYLAQDLVVRTTALAVLIGGGALAYALLALATGAARPGEVRQMLRRPPAAA